VKPFLIDSFKKGTKLKQILTLLSLAHGASGCPSYVLSLCFLSSSAPTCSLQITFFCSLFSSHMVLMSSWGPPWFFSLAGPVSHCLIPSSKKTLIMPIWDRYPLSNRQGHKSVWIF
jgi:hypothetical protein